MKTFNSKTLLMIVGAAGLALSVAYAQAPAPAAPQVPPGAGRPGGPGGGRGGGLPGGTAEQNRAVTEMIAALLPLTTAAATARRELATIAFANVGSTAGITTAVEKLRVAELALATARAEAFARLQAGPNKLNPDQVTALINSGGAMPGGRGGGGRGAGGPALAPGPGGAGRGH